MRATKASQPTRMRPKTKLAYHQIPINEKVSWCGCQGVGVHFSLAGAHDQNGTQ